MRTENHGFLQTIMTERYEEYHFYKDLGICVRCHKNTAEPHKVMCMECAVTDNERSRLKRKENITERKKHDLDKYYWLKEQGICTYCKHERVVAGKTKCAKCLAKIRNKRNAQRQNIERSERTSYGLCYICGNKAIKGKGVCQKCYKTRLESIERIMHMPVSQYWKNENDLIFKRNKKKVW